MFQSWQNEYDEDEPSSSKGTSWFKKQYSAKGSKKNWGGNQGTWNSGRSKEVFMQKRTCSTSSKIRYMNGTSF